VKYQGNFGGVAVTFTLANFSQKVVERFNEALAKEVTKNVAEVRQSSVVYG
jgi:ribosomal protein S3AE